MNRCLSISLFACAALCAGISGCTTNAATGKKILTLGMTRSEEISLGAQAAPEFTKEYGGKVENSQLQQYVTNIGSKMAAKTEAQNPTLPWEFTLLNTEVVNAFALPGGKVFFTRGLAEQLTNEAQMAGVLGHEIGHVTAQHGAQRIASQTAFNVGMVAAAVVVGVSGNEQVQKYGALGVPALAIGGNLVLLKYGRDEELEADRLGVRYMSSVGYNPRGQLEVMQVLAKLSQGNSQPAILSTHPDPAARIEQIQKLLSTEYASTQGNPNYQEFKDRYQVEFLEVIKTVPRPPKQKAAVEGVPAAALVDLRDATTWCGVCAAAARQESHAKAPEPGPVPPHKGVYAYIAPAP